MGIELGHFLGLFEDTTGDLVQVLEVTAAVEAVAEGQGRLLEVHEGAQVLLCGGEITLNTILFLVFFHTF